MSRSTRLELAPMRRTLHMPETTNTPSPELEAMRSLVADLRKSNQISDREERLMNENAKLRDKLRRTRVDLDETKGKVPKDGSRVLSVDEAKEFEDFRKLNLKPDAIKAKLDETAKLSEKLAQTEAEKLFDTVGELLGVENPAALKKLLARADLDLELRDVRVKQDDGSFKVEQVPFAKKRGDDKAQPEPLTDYIEREESEFIPALMTAPENANDDDTRGTGARSDEGTAPTRRLGSTSSERAQQTAGTPFPRRSTNNTPTGASRTEKKREERLNEKRSNPMYQL